MRTSFHHQSEAQPLNGPLTAATSPDTPSPTPPPQHRAQFPSDIFEFDTLRTLRVGEHTTSVHPEITPQSPDRLAAAPEFELGNGGIEFSIQSPSWGSAA